MANLHLKPRDLDRILKTVWRLEPERSWASHWLLRQRTRGGPLVKSKMKKLSKGRGTPKVREEVQAWIPMVQQIFERLHVTDENIIAYDETLLKWIDGVLVLQRITSSDRESQCDFLFPSISEPPIVLCVSPSELISLQTSRHLRSQRHLWKPTGILLPLERPCVVLHLPV